MTLVVNQRVAPAVGDEIAELRLYMMNASVLSEDDLHRRSLLIEAKNAK